MKFTAHNIQFPDGTLTRPGEQLLAESAGWLAIKNVIDIFCKDCKTAVDLGCLEGGFTVELAKAGFNTLGVEGRAINYEKCLLVKEMAGIPLLNFRFDDARNVMDKFDLVLCRGLLYHLDNPAKFISHLSKTTNKVLILHTHYAPEKDWRYWPLISQIGKLHKMGINIFYRPWRLSTLRKNKSGFKGRWFMEWKWNTMQEKINQQVWSAINNHRSFWLIKPDIERLLKEFGFEVFEYRVPEDTGGYYNYRVCYVATKINSIGEPEIEKP